jgi:outer membrane lipoprotein-sorting protein
MRRVLCFNCGALVCLILLLLLSTGCTSSQSEEELYGAWVSSTDSRVFEFYANGRYKISDRSNGQVTEGEYREISTRPTLRDKQFELVGAGMNIRFSEDGENFGIYVDGMLSNTSWYRASREINGTKSSE